MKKFLKAITLLLVFAMLLSAFAAFAKKDGTTADTEGTVTTSASASDEPSAEELENKPEEVFEDID